MSFESLVRQASEVMIPKHICSIKWTILLVFFMVNLTVYFSNPFNFINSLINGYDTNMDIWVPDLACCSHSEEVATRLAPNLCGATLMHTPSVSAKGPSGVCTVDVTIIKVTQGPVRYALNVIRPAVYLDLIIQVKGPGPVPVCEGSFITFHVYDASHGKNYQFGWHFWNGKLNITSVQDAIHTSSDPCGRKMQQRIVLPKSGIYILEVLYKTELYAGMLDRDEGENIIPPMSESMPVLTTVNPWLTVNDVCFSTLSTQLPLSRGCPCDGKHIMDYNIPGKAQI